MMRDIFLTMLFTLMGVGCSAKSATESTPATTVTQESPKQQGQRSVVPQTALSSMERKLVFTVSNASIISESLAGKWIARGIPLSHDVAVASLDGGVTVCFFNSPKQDGYLNPKNGDAGLLIAVKEEMHDETAVTAAGILMPGQRMMVFACLRKGAVSPSLEQIGTTLMGIVRPKLK